MKHLKIFNTINSFNSWVNSNKYITPYVSKIKSNGNINYQKRILIHQIEFIESSGSNHIIIPLTHFPVLSNTNDKYFKVYQKFQILNHGNDCKDGFTLLYIHDGVKWNYGIWNTEENIKQKYIYNIENNWNDEELNYNNEHIIYENTIYTWISNWNRANLYLFCWEENNTLSYHSISRLYELKIWDNNDNLIMHLVPYKNELTNVEYMHDNITNNDYYFEE